MLTRSGAKLLDFGLAKFAPSPSGSTLDAGGAGSPTVAGAVLGTFQYMAPEQLEGKDADPRSDLFAFGLILSEMLTGRKVSRGEPPAPTAHPHLDRIIGKCLARDPDARWQSAADLRTQLQWLTETGAGGQGPGAGEAPHRLPIALAWGAAAVLFLALAALGWIHFREAPPQKRVLKLSLLPPEKSSIGGPIALSPDGSRVAFPPVPTAAASSGCDPSIRSQPGRCRGRAISLLVARWPQPRLLHLWQAETDRHRRRAAADAVRRQRRWPWWLLEPVRGHHLCRQRSHGALPGRRHGRRGGAGYDTRR